MVGWVGGWVGYLPTCAEEGQGSVHAQRGVGGREDEGGGDEAEGRAVALPEAGLGRHD